MDGIRIREYWSNEAQILLDTYRQFETLVPASKGAGADHRGEDGRFVEDLIREYLRRHLPKNLEVLTGFIVRPAVKTGENGRERNTEKDAHSSQLDIIVYDSSNYPIFQKFGDNAIVVPEGVVGIISVKKTLRDTDIEKECSALFETSKLCRNIRGLNGLPSRGPYLSLIGATTDIEKVKMGVSAWIFSKIENVANAQKTRTFDQLIGYIGALDSWSIFKKRPDKKFRNVASYISLMHQAGEEHLALQFLLTGLLSVYFDPSRNLMSRPGFTAFKPRSHDGELGDIEVDKLR